MKLFFRCVICSNHLGTCKQKKRTFAHCKYSTKGANNYNASIYTTDTQEEHVTRIVQGVPVNSTQPQLEKSCAETRRT